MLDALRRIESRQFTEVGTGGGDGFSLPPAQSAGGSIDRLRDYLNVDAALASRGGSHHKARLTDLRRPPRRQLLRRLRRPSRRRLRRRRRTAKVSGSAAA